MGNYFQSENVRPETVLELCPWFCLSLLSGTYTRVPRGDPTFSFLLILSLTESFLLVTVRSSSFESLEVNMELLLEC